MMWFKLFGAAVLFFCGGFYSKVACDKAKKELFEVELALLVVSRVRNEIADYGVPLGEILREFNIEGGAEGFIGTMTSERVKTCLSELRSVGLGYGKEEIRICDKLYARLSELKKQSDTRLKEVSAISRVKGYGVAAAVVILLV